VSVRRAEFSSEQPLSELLRRQRKEEPLRELSTRQRSDEVFRSELSSARKGSRMTEPLPSASDYSDLESPERETAPTKLLSVVSKPIDRDRQAMEVAREERRLRMLQREMEKEDTKSSRKRKEAKHNYAAKVLGNLGTLGEVRRRPGGKEGHGEGVVGKRREERKRVNKRREERKRVNKEQVVEDEDGITEVESKVKRSKRSVAAEEEDWSGGGSSKRVKPAKRRDQKKSVLDESHSSLLDLGSQDLPDDRDQEDVGDRDVMKELDDFIGE